jgi:hypothetical protein
MQWTYVFTRNKKIVAFTAVYVLFLALIVSTSKSTLLLNTSEIGWLNGKLLAYVIMLYLGICCAILVDEPLAIGVESG